MKIQKYAKYEKFSVLGMLNIQYHMIGFVFCGFQK